MVSFAFLTLQNIHIPHTTYIKNSKEKLKSCIWKIEELKIVIIICKTCKGLNYKWKVLGLFFDFKYFHSSYLYSKNMNDIINEHRRDTIEVKVVYNTSLFFLLSSVTHDVNIPHFPIPGKNKSIQILKCHAIFHKARKIPL